MREIKFRGRNLDNDKWIYGYLYKTEHETFIAHDSFESDCGDNYCLLQRVLPETVGQFTGLPDKNGTEIYKGDIVKLKAENIICQIIWCEKDAMFEIPVPKSTDAFYCSAFIIEREELEIIGNIHQNPELLEKTHD